MGSPPICEGTLLGFWVFLLFSVIFCYGNADQFEVVGVVECADCSESRIKASQAFSGLGVTIDCKLANGEFKTRVVGDVSNEGKFKVSLPEEMVKDGYQLKEECFAQLHSASAAPCFDAQSGLEASKIVWKAKTIGKKNVFGPIANLKFSSLTCTSALWWSFYKHPPLPKLPLPFPKAYPPPWKKFGHVYKKPLPPSIPIYKKPLPSPVHKKLLPPKVLIHKKPLPPKVLKPNKPFPPPSPVYKKPFPPSVPVFKKPIPPPVPVYKRLPPPPAPVYQKRLPPPVPVFKKPCPPPVPIAKKLLPPHVPIYKKPLLPPTPIYNKPNPPPFYKWSIHKPIPPVYKLLPPIPPLYKKPCPPILKPPHYLPKLPPKHFPLPKFGPNPPIPPYFPHP
ncbi:proline-rich protein 4-like [Vitis riparia]|uniref:proline-rich protein 4-like n=1 Tax=Vitis riparia TaxID=96939 RepID=UPI00155A2C9D|nr:proline-rich protein 4-like [Vitis riparia]